MGVTMPSLDSGLVAFEWRRRCAAYARLNRRWTLLALLWLLAVGIPFLAAFLLGPAGDLYLAIAAISFAFGLPTFLIASLAIGRMLRCPRCGNQAVKSFTVAGLRAAEQRRCAHCGCDLQDSLDGSRGGWEAGE